MARSRKVGRSFDRDLRPSARKGTSTDRGRLTRKAAVVVVAAGALGFFATPAAEAAVPAGCTVHHGRIYDADYVDAHCGVSAAGSYFRGYIVCKKADAHGVFHPYTKYGQWIWQGATATERVYCDNFDYASSWGAQVRA